MNGATRRRTALVLALGLLCGSVASAAPPPDEDDAFFAALERPESLDQRSVAKFLFGVAAILDGGRSSVRLVQSELVEPSPAADAARSALAGRFEAYAGALAGYQESVSKLLDAPASAAALFRALSAGHRACWQLELQRRLLENYGAGTREMMSILTSLEACTRFRRAAFHPRIEETVAAALGASDRDERALADCRGEVRDLERLVEDLRRIDAEP